MRTERQNRNGFTLIGALVAMVLVAIIVMGAAYLMQLASKVEKFGNVENDIERTQLLNLQLSKNSTFILKQPGFEKTGALYQCLQQAGSNCTRVPAPPSYSESLPGYGNSGAISSTMSFQPNCKTANSCESVTVTVNTSYQGNAGSFKSRKAASQILGYMLAPRAGFTYGCVQTQGLITQLDFATGQAVCQPLQGTLASNAAPLENFGPVTPSAVQAMTRKNCGGSGFSTVGSFQSQDTCMSMAPPPPPSPGPSPSPAPSPKPKPGDCSCSSAGQRIWAVPDCCGSGQYWGAMYWNCVDNGSGGLNQIAGPSYKTKISCP